MTHHFTRRALLTSALSSVATIAFAEAPLTSLRPTARPNLDPASSPLAQVTTSQIIEDANLNGVVGFVVADAKTGQLLESTDPDIALPPASVTKAVTALFALDALGPDYRFKTRLLGTGPVQNSRRPHRRWKHIMCRAPACISDVIPTRLVPSTNFAHAKDVQREHNAGQRQFKGIPPDLKVRTRSNHITPKHAQTNAT